MSGLSGVDMSKAHKTQKTPPEYIEGMVGGTIRDLKISKLALEYRDLEFRVSPRTGDLVEDIGKNGQQFPILVRKLDGGRFEVISGYRRVRALQALGWTTVKAIVRDDLQDDDMAYKVSYMENERRKNLSGVDKAHAISKLLLAGKTGKQVQEIFGISERQFQRFQKIATFPADLKRALEENLIQTTHALILMQAYEANEKKVDLKLWIDWIVEMRDEGTDISVVRLKKELNKEYKKDKSVPKYFERKGKSFRLYPMSFDPKKTDDETRRLMKAKLEQALEMLKK